MYRHIAIPIDGSAESLQAVSWGAKLARSSGALIELINVAAPSRIGDELRAAGLQDAEKLPQFQEAHLRLGAEATRLEESGLRAVKTILTGAIPSALTRHLEESNADLVVMATHDPGMAERVLVGSVVEHVVRNCSKPVLVIHGSRKTDGSPGTIRRILVPLDGSESSDRILPYATELAMVAKAELLLLTVLLPIMATAASGLADPAIAVALPIGLLETDAESVGEERSWLEEKAAQARSQGLAVSANVEVHGNAGHAILDYAKAHSADVIAMSTHGRGALKRMVMGSVATQVMRSSEVAVLSCKPNDEAMPDATGA